jgi:hypothetical protein
VSVKVLFLIWNLVEDFRTAQNWTWERLFVSMDPQMVEKIVPFAKEFAAMPMVTGEDTC